RGPHVQVQAVLVHSLVEGVKIAESAALDAARAPFRGAANAIPWLYGLRRLPAQLPYWRSGIRDSLKDPDSRSIRCCISNWTALHLKGSGAPRPCQKNCRKSRDRSGGRTFA